jgi:hypothetical protein
MNAFFRWFAVAGFACLSLAPVRAQVVINEIFYHAPEDLEDLQYLELHNAGEQAVDLSGWAFSKGVKYRFPAGSRIEPRGFLVLAVHADRFRQAHPGVVLAGVFESRISRKGERLELKDASGKTIDSVRFSDRSPWPAGADGQSGSLERICPTAEGDDAANWISSPLSKTRETPAGTPGKVNAGYSASLPPVIRSVSFSPEVARPGESLTVEATLGSASTVASVGLRYRLAGPGFERDETVISMVASPSGKYAVTIPAPPPGQLLRFRVEVVGGSGARRFFPAETEPRPAFSVYGLESVAPGLIPAQVPVASIIHTTAQEMKAAEERSNAPIFGGAPPPNPDREARDRGRRALEETLDLSPAWFAWVFRLGATDAARVAQVRAQWMAALEARQSWMSQQLDSPGIADRVDRLPQEAARWLQTTLEGLGRGLNETERTAWKRWMENRPARSASGERMVTGRADLEGLWFGLTLTANVDLSRLPEWMEVIRGLHRQREALITEVMSGTGKDSFFRDQRDRADDLSSRIPGALKPLLGESASRLLDQWQRGPREALVRLREQEGAGEGGFPFGPGGPFGRGGPGGPMGNPFGGPPSEPGSFRSALVFQESGSQRPQVFDFVQVNGRKGGQKVHLHKDRTLRGMNTVGIIFEGETAAVVEPLAYEVYRKSGMAAEESFPVRLLLNGKPSGYSLLVEQPNQNFLRRNRVKDGGNLYKLLWFGQGVTGQHEKHSNRHGSHDDLATLVDGLEKVSGAEQWDYIRRHFEVEQVATYFAVNMVLSHWDGFFNNYFTYHDVNGTGKWSMYPWDQDSTWGLRAMQPDDSVFTRMPLTFGMNGDSPVDGAGWWRGPGWFSGPLLANPEFRKVFLAQTRRILDTVYTEAVMGPVIDRLENQLLPEVRARAQQERQDAEGAVRALRSDITRVREHLRERRRFLLDQPELKAQ